MSAEVHAADFVQSAATSIKLGRGDRYTHCIMNPPYMKIGTGSEARGLLRAIGLETVNMYSGFVGLALDLLVAGGELVAIIPRSFCNGPYYQPFRKFIFKRAAILHIHLFESRNKAFKSDGVLQENIIVHLKRDHPQGTVKVSTSTDGSFSDYGETSYDFTKIVYPDDDEQFIHVPTVGSNELLASHAFAHKLKDLGLSVSTGPVVDFRMRNAMCEPENSDATPASIRRYARFGQKAPISPPMAQLKPQSSGSLTEKQLAGTKTRIKNLTGELRYMRNWYARKNEHLMNLETFGKVTRCLRQDHGPPTEAERLDALQQLNAWRSLQKKISGLGLCSDTDADPIEAGS